MERRPYFVVVTALVLAYVLFFAVLVVPTDGDSHPGQSRKHPKFSSLIARQVEASESLPQGVPLTDDLLYTIEPPMDAYMTSGLLQFDGLGRLQVYIHVSTADADVASELTSLGAIIERQDGPGLLIQARVPLKILPQIGGLDYVVSVTLPNYGQTDLGSRLTQGDALLQFDDLRADLGVSGSGVTVGVISDGIFGLADAVSSGDLPATALSRDGGGKLVSTTGGIIATSFRADGDLESGFGQETEAEGVAILEIVHDIAPGAQLRFANVSTHLEFIAAVDFLAANSDVVIDDIAWFGFLYDQSSPVSINTVTELNRTTNPIRGYYTSVGNHALRHYQEAYLDSGTDGTSLVGVPGNFHRFSATADTTDCLGLGNRVANLVLLGPGRTAAIFLTWDDIPGGVTTDYDLYVLENGSNIVVAASFNDNPGVTGEPTESVAFTNNTGSSKSYDIYIQDFLNGSAAKTFDMFVRGEKLSSCNQGQNTVFNYNTMSRSVPAQSDAGGGVVSVGAIDASDPGADEIEPFSSRGPTNNGVIKPDVTAVDGVSVTGSGGFSVPFFGTSAAAPHVAGLAALLLDLIPGLLAGEAGDNPAADRTELRAAIPETAVDLGAGGADNTFGSGRVNGLSAGQSLVELVSITVTPASTSVAKGLTQQFTATGSFTDSTTQDLTTTATCASSTTAVATIGSTGLSTAVGEGITTITATSDSISGSTVLTVTPAELVSIAVTPASTSVAKGLTQQFTATGAFTDSTTQDLTATATWASSATTVATISGAGLATAVGEGTTTNTATSDGISGSTVLTVTSVELVSIAVTPASTSVAKGLTQQFTATGTFTDSTTQDLTATATWASSTTTTVATISGVGLATTVGEGTTTITATSGGISGFTVLTVTLAEPVSITVTPASTSVAQGLTQQFTATGAFTDSTP